MSLENGSTYAWRKLRRAVLERDGWECRYCSQPANTVDHVIPRAEGGPDAEWNLVAACTSCNSSKGSKTAGRFFEGRADTPASVELFPPAAPRITRVRHLELPTRQDAL